MDELIKMISEKVGITPDKASMAVQLVWATSRARRRPCPARSTAS